MTGIGSLDLEIITKDSKTVMNGIDSKGNIADN